MLVISDADQDWLIEAVAHYVMTGENRGGALVKRIGDGVIERMLPLVKVWSER